jgi:hypothetical protein
MQVGSTGYSYDANGNMITRGSQTIAWDVENRPVTVSDNGTIAEFVCDGDGTLSFNIAAIVYHILSQRYLSGVNHRPRHNISLPAEISTLIDLLAVIISVSVSRKDL